MRLTLIWGEERNWFLLIKLEFCLVVNLWLYLDWTTWEALQNLVQENMAKKKKKNQVQFYFLSNDFSKNWGKFIERTQLDVDWGWNSCLQIPSPLFFLVYHVDGASL